MFKSAEERAAERREREAAEARAQVALAEQARAEKERREREALLATPVGGATAAMEAGQLFYEVQLQVGAHVGSAGFGGIQGQHTTSSSAVTLGEIEKLGLAPGARGLLLHDHRRDQHGPRLRERRCHRRQRRDGRGLPLP